MNVTLAQQVKPSADVLVQEVGGEAVLLDLTSERYFGLDPVGTRIWTLLGQEPQLQLVFEALCTEYEVEPSRLQTDLLALVGQLAEAGLVEVH
jgi:hypothetical protein